MTCCSAKLIADLGSAVASCSLSSVLLGPQALQRLSSVGTAMLDGIDTDENGPTYISPDSQTPTNADIEVNQAVAAKVSQEVPLDLGEYSGLVIRTLGDGNVYTVVLRTPEYAETGIEYHADFQSSSSSFKRSRLPFSTFVPVREGRRVVGAGELDRRQLVGLAFAFYPQRNNPSQTTGQFYLSVSNIKAYRKRDEPEIIYISDACVESGRTRASSDAGDADASKYSRVQTKLAGERLIQASGLTYFILRATELTDAPSSRKLSFTQVA